MSMAQISPKGEGCLDFGQSPGVASDSVSFSNEALIFLSLQTAQETVPHFLE